MVEKGSIETPATPKADEFGEMREIHRRMFLREQEKQSAHQTLLAHDCAERAAFAK